MYGPREPLSEELHKTRYRQPNETFEDAMNRIASTLADDDEHYHKFREILLNMRFAPGGRVQAAIGTSNNVTAFNCFVSGIIADTLRGENGIFDRLKEAAITMAQGGGIGYDFSTLRPEGYPINNSISGAGGPLSFMPIYSATCHAVSSAGNRRGAQMGVLRIDHPDIEAFINAKHDNTSLTGFNISIGITDKFMEAVQSGDEFALMWNGEIKKKLDARILWEKIMRSNHDWAEPGVLFIDRINDMNNLQYCETISATNPCAEQGLPPFGACLLGSFNLPKYLAKTNSGLTVFRYPQFVDDIHTVVRAMDNVVDVAKYPLPEQKTEAKNKRRMGLGIMGYANASEALSHPYGTDQALLFLSSVLSQLRDTAYAASVELAKEKGPFPLWDKKEYSKGEFISTLPLILQGAIREHGIRNSHLTSIAPTGTIALTCDNISSGIEPVWQHSYNRIIKTADGVKTVTIEDYGHKYLGVTGKTVAQCSVADHVNTLITAQKYIDSSVSKTVNVTKEIPWDDFKDIYYQVWKSNGKGCSTYNMDGRRAGIIDTTTSDEPDACFLDPETGIKTCE